jgi:hypothetical protein
MFRDELLEAGWRAGRGVTDGSRQSIRAAGSAGLRAVGYAGFAPAGS